MDENNAQENNISQENVPMTKKEKADAAGRDVAEVAARGAGRYFGGALGGAAVDAALKTKLGQKVIGQASKQINRNPLTRNMLVKNQENISNLKPIANSLVDNMGGSDGSSTSNIKSTKGISNLFGSKSDSNTYGEGSISGTVNNSGLWKKLPFNVKLAIIGIGGGLVFTVIFLVILITSLMELDIIDIGSDGSSGLGYSSDIYLNNAGNGCASGVIVDGTGVVPFEKYVAGVVSNENYAYKGMEAYKAQAIAARTFVLSVTNNCQKSIGNSDSSQTFTENPREWAIEAAEATEGLVLTYDSKIFTTMYDSFYTRGSDYICNGDNCSVTYTKLPNKETHLITIPQSYVLNYNFDPAGHGKGMSQHVAYYLADQGYTYEEILYYFYSDGVEIASLEGSSGYTSGLSASGDYAVRIGMPVQGNTHDNKYWFSNENISYSSGNLGQCTWYVYGRANEILDYAGSDLNWNLAPHAKYWLDYNIKAGANAFSYSTDVNEPKEGAIIVWGSDRFGHVAIVEKVNNDGTIDYSEANISSAKSSSNPYGFRYQSHVSYTGTGVGTISNIWNGYSFIGYIYMIE